MTLFLTKMACLVWSPAFRRRMAVFHPNRLKAELRSRIAASCDIAKGGH